MSKRSWFFVWVLCTVWACHAKHDAKDQDEIVAKVNAGVILRSQFQALVDRNLSRYTNQGKSLPPNITVRIEESVMRRLVDDTIIEQKAQALGISVSDADVDEKFKEHKERFRTPEAFTDYLQRSHNTEEALKDDLRKNMLRDRVVEKLGKASAIRDEDIAKYYQDNLKHFAEPEQMRVKRIFFPVADNATPAEKRRVEKEAKKVLALVKKPKANFDDLAHVHGKGPEAARDGDLGLILPGRMPELDKLMAQGLKPNHLSNVLATEHGFEILKLVEHHAARQKPLTEVRQSIELSLKMRAQNEERQAVLHQLKSDANVQVLIQFVPVPPQHSSDAHEKS